MIAVLDGPRHWPRPTVLMSGALVVVAAAFVALVAASALPHSSHEVTREGLLAYQRALAGPLQHGGEVVQLGLKVGIGDLGSEHRTAPAVIAEQARAWQRDLSDVRRQLAAVKPPASLRAEHAELVRALDGYVGAARAIEEAAGADGATRDQLLDRAAAMGREADAAFDRAGANVQHARARLGLDPDASLRN
jgi:hypothetical protein